MAEKMYDFITAGYGSHEAAAIYVIYVQSVRSSKRIYNKNNQYGRQQQHFYWQQMRGIHLSLKRLKVERFPMAKWNAYTQYRE